jgi:hypothetical protein
MNPIIVITAGFSFLLAVLVYSCNSSSTKQPAEAEKIATDYMTVGKNAATEAQSVLAKNLVGAINKAGTEYAVEFCNTKAIQLTDSMAHLLNTEIKRVTDRPRNTANLVDEKELEYFRILKDKMLKGERPEAKVTETDEKMVGYYPIITNSMCLQCHGKKGIDIDAATSQKIKKLYPADKATGYGNNELRGLWVIEMEKNTN